MKKLFCIIALLALYQTSFGQIVDFKKIRFKGLPFHASKSEITEQLGSPLLTYKPNYTCGLLSSAKQDKDFFTLHYNNLKFTGNDTNGYLLEELNFKKDPSAVLEYDHHPLSYNTSLAELAEIFGKDILVNFKGDTLNGAFVILQQGADDGIRMEINDGKLAYMQYWAGC